MKSLFKSGKVTFDNTLANFNDSSAVRRKMQKGEEILNKIAANSAKKPASLPSPFKEKNNKAESVS